MLSDKIDLFGGAVWGEQSGPALQAPTPAKAQQTILNALLKVPWTQEHRNPLDWTVSLIIHIIIVLVLVIAPLYFTQVIDFHEFQATFLVAPAPPSPPPPPQSVMKAIKAPKIIQISKMVAPMVIPKNVAIVRDEAPVVYANNDSGIVGGTGNVLGGLIGSEPLAPPPPPPPVREEKGREIVRIGGVVKPPRQIYAPPPQYPELAKISSVQGTVIIEAVIDEQGNVINVRAVAGPALLIAEALRTVMTWKYEPTYLDGKPAAVDMKVEVHFSLY